MILTGKISVKKAIPVRLAFVRTVCLCLPIVFVFFLLVFSGFAFAPDAAPPAKTVQALLQASSTPIIREQHRFLPEQLPFL